MIDNYAASLKEVLRHEGGFTDHPKDAGGATNKGVTQATYDGYRRLKRQIPRSVKQITAQEVADCYKVLYWDKINGDDLPYGIDFCTFDAAVNSGTGRAEKWLQQAINKAAGAQRLKEDGEIGPATLDAADDYPAAEVIDAFIDLRLGFMKVAKNTKTGAWLWPIFGGGWSNRLLGDQPKGATTRARNGVIQVATAMAAQAPLPMPGEVAAAPKAELPAAAMVRPTPFNMGSAGLWLKIGLVAAGAGAAYVFRGAVTP